LAENSAVLGVALSGAGPSVLLISEAFDPTIETLIRDAVKDPGLEIIHTTIAKNVNL
jgi:homoserine kinase